MGKAVRQQAPLESHAEWSPSPYRVDPVTLLEEQAETRVPELVPIRYGRMVASPFAFYRGAAYVMAADLASTPRSGLRVQACGDAHLMKLRGLRLPGTDAHVRHKRLRRDPARSLGMGCKASRRQLRGGHTRPDQDKDRRSLVLAVVRHYRETMRAFAEMKNLEVWYAKLDIDTVLQQLRGQKDAAVVVKNAERQLWKRSRARTTPGPSRSSRWPGRGSRASWPTRRSSSPSAIPDRRLPRRVHELGEGHPSRLPADPPAR